MIMSRRDLVIVKGATLKVVQEYIYVYLGQIIQLWWHHFKKEATRRIRLGLAAFGNMRDIFESSIPQHLGYKTSATYT